MVRSAKCPNFRHEGNLRYKFVTATFTEANNSANVSKPTSRKVDAGSYIFANPKS